MNNGKVPRSFAIPEETDNMMRQREDVNWSAVVSRFLQEYLTSGQSAEAVQAVRLEQIENELAQERQEVEQLEAEAERLRESLRDKREDRIAKFRAMDDFDGDLEPHNPAVRAKCKDLDLTPKQFIAEYEAWRDDDE